MANIIRRSFMDSDPLNQDLRNFLFKVHKTLGYTPPSPIQYDFCELIQNSTGIEPGTGARIILMGFRGVAKSHVTTTASIWFLRRDRTENVLVTSATGRFASLISTFAWQMVSEFDWLADMKPATSQRRSSIEFDVGGAPLAQQHASFASVPITGQITGRRFSRGIGDDLETPNTSDTELARTDLLTRASELGGALVKPGGHIYLLGTSQTEDTFYLKMEERGYTIRIYPILFPHMPSGDKALDKTRVIVDRYGSRLAPFIRRQLEDNPLLAGTSTNPERFSEVDIRQRRREWGLTEFERQFLMLLDAGLGRGNPLKFKDIPILEINPPSPTSQHFLLPSHLEFRPLPALKIEGIKVDSMTGDGTLYAPIKAEVEAPVEEVAMHIDTSGEGDNETTWTVGCEMVGRVYIPYQGSTLDGHSAETLEAIAKDAKTWRVTTILIESNFGQSMFGELLRPKLEAISHPCEIVEVRAGIVSKEQRIVQALEPLITDHRLVLSAELLRRDFDVAYEFVEEAKRRFYRLSYQLTRISKTKGCLKWDDRVDGLAGVSSHFIGILQRRLEEAAEAGRIRKMEAEIDHMIEVRDVQGLDTMGANVNKGPRLGRPHGRTRK